MMIYTLNINCLILQRNVISDTLHLKVKEMKNSRFSRIIFWKLQSIKRNQDCYELEI